ncbi:hypothetical protein [Tardiphaga sp. 367_B4_N1_1]|uniref:hypothetical protein n=1 Tax=Tardiphaga sp. 367_B4_N1_1 TaxID=3240777 RepID=UPI003F2507E8
MGDPARNERIKLRATFYNNLSVAAIVAGALGPTLALYRGEFSNVGIPQFIGVISAIGVGAILRWTAEAHINEISD